MIVAFTGHRPDKLPDEDIKKIKAALEAELLRIKPTRVRSGMATGIDVFGLEIAHRLSIPATAAIPWAGHGASPAWAKQGLDEYIRYLEMCDEHEVISEGDDYKPWFYQVRNVWMVDNCNILLAVWDGSSGGTRNCVMYARKVGRVIRYYRWDTGTFEDCMKRGPKYA